MKVQVNGLLLGGGRGRGLKYLGKTSDSQPEN